jgi:two-component system phosphate regulon sensor histidine kinase PhoR
MTSSDVVAGAIGALVGVSALYAALRPHVLSAVRTAQPAEPVAQDEAEQAARLVEALPFAAFIVDRDVRVHVFNHPAEELFAVSPGRAIGRALIEVVPSVEIERMVIAALRGEERTQDVAYGRGTRERYLGVTVRPYEGRAMAIAADRTEYLAGERVRREFVGNVSHELRTPLSAMKLMLETMMLSDEDAEARALFLPQVAHEVERMIRIVEDLLELARSESGMMALRRERFDLGDLAESTVNTFAQRADNLNVQLVLDTPNPVWVEADRGRLAQVVVNLLDNALRHTAAGGRVIVRVRREGDEGFLEVSDTGIGIPFADLPRVFERFYVVDRSRSREHGGTGLGLAIAKHLVEAHGGTLQVDSVYGHGATFTMRLPASEGKAELGRP